MKYFVFFLLLFISTEYYSQESMLFNVSSGISDYDFEFGYEELPLSESITNAWKLQPSYMFSSSLRLRKSLWKSFYLDVGLGIGYENFKSLFTDPNQLQEPINIYGSNLFTTLNINGTFIYRKIAFSVGLAPSVNLKRTGILNEQNGNYDIKTFYINSYVGLEFKISESIGLNLNNQFNIDILEKRHVNGTILANNFGEYWRMNRLQIGIDYHFCTKERTVSTDKQKRKKRNRNKRR